MIPRVLVNGLLQADWFEPIAVHVNGLPFTAEGSLAVAIDATVDHVHNGIPFDADGRVCVEEGSASYHLAGRAYTASNRLLVDIFGTQANALAGLPLTSAGALAVEMFASATFALDFARDPYASLHPAFSHVRATESTLIQRYDGSYVQMLPNEFGLDGGRRVENLLNNTDTLATQGVTVEAADYWLSFTGTGSVAVSGVATDSLAGTGASDRVSKKITAGSAGTMTLTVTGSVTNAMLTKSRAGQTIADPEYVSRGVLSSPYHGWGVDGVRWFGTGPNGEDLTDPASGLPVLCTGLATRQQATNLWEYANPEIANLNSSGTTVEVAGFAGLPRAIHIVDNSAVSGATRSMALTGDYVMQALVKMDDGGVPVPGASSVSSSVDFRIHMQGSSASVLGVVPLGGDLYLVWGSATVTGSSAQYGIVKYTGHSARGFKVLLFQVHAGTEPLPFVLTDGLSVTVDGDAFPHDIAEIGGTAGTWIVEHTPTQSPAVESGNQTLLDLYADANNRARVYNASGDVGVQVTDGGVSQWSASDAGANWTAGTLQRLAVRFETDDGSLVTDGDEHLLDASMSVPDATVAYIGGDASSEYSGSIARIAYYGGA